MKRQKNNNNDNLINVKSNNIKDLKILQIIHIGNFIISKEIIFPININKSISFYNFDNNIMISNIKEKEKEN